jgi:hypothetical protein
VALAFVGVLAVAAGCGGAGNAAGPAPTSQGNGFQAYLSCLSNNGVKLPTGGFGRGGGNRPSDRPTDQPRPTDRPSGGFGGGRGGGFGGFFGTQAPTGVDQATWDKAMTACNSLRPTGGPGGGGGNNSAFAAYRNCLNDHGISPTANAFSLSTADPKVAAALKACAVLRPTGRPFPSRTN